MKKYVGCNRCKKNYTIFVNEADWNEYLLDHRKIDELFPKMQASTKELLRHGTCQSCWDALHSVGPNDSKPEILDLQMGNYLVAVTTDSIILTSYVIRNQSKHNVCIDAERLAKKHGYNPDDGMSILHDRGILRIAPNTVVQVVNTTIT
jgi:hypothetical protein